MFNQSKYVNDYAKDNYKRLAVFVPKAAYPALEARFKALGYTSLNSYVNSLLAADLGLTSLKELTGGQTEN